MDSQSETWHYGLIARWWAEFNVAKPEELAYFETAIRRFGEPALDVGCGTGRILIPLRAAGLAVDGVDVSADMIAETRAGLRKRGLNAQLTVQAIHALDIGRTYRTIYLCGVFGIGGSRDSDREALRRIHRHLEPGGALLIDHELPNATQNEAAWARWLPGHRTDIPRPWPDHGERRRTSGGDEIELLSRVADFDPVGQRQRLEIRARLWRGDRLVKEEEGSLSENLYFTQEIAGLLNAAGFRNVAIEAAHSGRAATGDDVHVVFLAER